MLLQLSLRLGVVVTEIEQLPVSTIAEYIAVLKEPEKPTETADVQSDLMRLFGDPSKRT